MPAIQTRELSKSFGGRPAVDGLTFSVDAGEVFGLLGPNGAGKTTTLRMLAGLFAPDSGSGNGRDAALEEPVDEICVRALDLALAEWPQPDDLGSARQCVVDLGRGQDVR